MRIGFLFLCLTLFVFPYCVYAQAEDDLKKSCLSSAGGATTSVHGFTISVYRHPNQKEFPNECAAKVASPEGKTVFQAHDQGTWIAPVTGKDINGDGEPDAVIGGWSGGAHCCYTYWIVSLGEKPGLVTRIYNEEPLEFTDLSNDGRITLTTGDGRFDYFDGMCHACSPIPSVYLRFEGDQLKDVSDEFWPKYLKEIENARKELDPQELMEFRAKFMPNRSLRENSYEETRGKVLTIILAYLYGGRADGAWKALEEMWPPRDTTRIRKLILKTRGKGFVVRSQDPSNFDE